MRTPCALCADVVAAATAVIVTLAGCAANATDHHQTSHVPANSADVAFMRRMIVQPQQAIEMSVTARTRSKDPTVTRLSEGSARTI